MVKKRTSLDALSLGANSPNAVEQEAINPQIQAQPKAREIVRQTAYLPSAVYEQLRRLAFEERNKMHDYLIEGLDLVFNKRGLPSIEELKSAGSGIE